jgi:putative transposase
VKYAFLQSQLAPYPVITACRVLAVSRSGYYAWCGRPPSARQKRQAELAAQIEQVHQDSRQTYGSPRVHQALIAGGQKVCLNTVARLMKQHQIRAKTRRPFVPRTTDSAHHQPPAQNLLQRDFAAHKPNQKWVADITYIPTDEGWLYLAGILDLYSRKLVGWAMDQHLHSALAGSALRMALARRGPLDGLIHHSDRGVQYACADYQQLLDRHGIQASMSRQGDCYDNACAESFWATLKTEWVHHQHYATREQARQSIFEYIEVFYNRQRLHSSLGYQCPEAFEAGLG